MSKRDFQSITWCQAVEDDFRSILEQSIREDVESIGDLTSLALIPEYATGKASIVSRSDGIIAGIPTVPIITETVLPEIRWTPMVVDGQHISRGDKVGTIEGPARGLMQAERLILNFVARLSGIASTTQAYVRAVQGTRAKVYDTRKTTPGWRLLEKYAVQCGGGHNHRAGLYDAILIKDNHLALAAGRAGMQALEYNPAEAVRNVRAYLERQDALGPKPPVLCHGCVPSSCKMRASLIAAVAEITGSAMLSAIIANTPCYVIEQARNEEEQVPREPAQNFPAKEVIVEVEVDTLRQFESVLAADPDIIMLDNMSIADMQKAVKSKNARKPQIELEASGGINLTTIRDVALTGVDRISVGALTHSFNMFDLGLDWE